MDPLVIEQARRDRNTIFAGLGAALLWLAVVSGISYAWAVSNRPTHAAGEGGHEPAPAASHSTP